MNKLLSVIIFVLLAFIFFQNDGCTYIDKKSEIVTVHDTAWQVHDSLIIKKLKIKETIHDTISTPSEYIADTSYPKLKAQYDSLVIAYLAKNIYTDTLKLDTLGYVAIADTVHKNNLQNRSYNYNYKIPTIHTTTTITKQAPSKGALFMGGGVTGNKQIELQTIQGGVLYKSKRDKIFGLHIGLNNNSQVIYGLSSYWKIK
jgi:hypothetical protein